LQQVAPEMLVSINKLTAARVPTWLDQYGAKKSAAKLP
jgi:hypothetical protein